MTNKNVERVATLQLTQPSGVLITSGEPLLFGQASGHKLCGVSAQEKVASGTVPPQDTASNQFTVDFEGVFNLSVTAKSSLSPSTGSAVAVGDLIYLDGGTLDTATGVTYGGTLDKNSGGVPFGIAMDAITSGVTAVIRVILANGSR